MSAGPRMESRLGTLRLRNPVLTASGTSGYGLDLVPHMDITRLGGIITKSLSLAPREGNKPARLAETPAGMLNSIGLQNIGVDAFLGDKLPRLREMGVTVIANIFGETQHEFETLARRFDQAEGVSALELNVSCPNTDKGGIEFGVDPVAVSRLTAAIKKITRLPVIVKLSPNVTDITVIARAAEEAGADILSLVNTYTGMSIDVEQGRPVLSSGGGGLSGPAIRPLAVLLVHRVARAVKIPLIGIGGIRSGRDALEFILAGASAVEVGTATFTEPGASLRIAGELEAHCARRSIERIASLVGALRSGPAPDSPHAGG